VRVVLQRVSEARVTVADEIVASIGVGLCLLVGVSHDDEPADAEAMAVKVCGLRVFPDDQGRMNRSVTDVGGEALVVSQFTLLGEVKRGRRPSFMAAAHSDRAEPLVDYLSDCLRQRGVSTSTGVFGAKMAVQLTNDGPVTLVVEVRQGSVV